MASNHRDVQTIENFVLVWLDSQKTHERNAGIVYFQELVNSIYVFTDCDQCLDFISDVKTEKIFLIISDTFARQISPAIGDLRQIDSIYIFAKKRDENEKWVKEIRKIKGVFTQCHPIYDAFRRDLRQCDDDLLPFSILPKNYTEEKMNSSRFLYRQLMTEILLDPNYQTTHSKLDFVQFCRSNYSENEYQLKLIEEFQKNYQPSAAIRWFTRDCFLSAMLNKALRLGNLDVIFQMDFFIQDLHRHIQHLHKQTRLIVYRGQGITEDVFQQILENGKGYLSFNHFLPATTDKEVALNNAQAARDYHQLVGVLFHIEINSPNGYFTSLDKVGYYQGANDQYLFTINTIFCIDSIAQTENLWQIKLRLTPKEDTEMKRLRNFLRKDLEDKNSPEQMKLLMTMSEAIDGFDKVEDASLEEKETDQISTEQDMDVQSNEFPKEE